MQIFLAYRFADGVERASPVAANIGKELCPSIPSSALRAPSPHVWGEGDNEEVLWERSEGSPKIGIVPRHGDPSRKKTRSG